jgi:hypothetical protein
MIDITSLSSVVRKSLKPVLRTRRISRRTAERFKSPCAISTMSFGVSLAEPMISKSADESDNPNMPVRPAALIIERESILQSQRRENSQKSVCEAGQESAAGSEIVVVIVREAQAHGLLGDGSAHAVHIYIGLSILSPRPGVVQGYGKIDEILACH